MEIASKGSQRQIGQYQVTAKIGQGGMSEVYRARDAKLGRDVALKLLPEATAHDSQSMARLQHEARTLATLNHPNIAAIYGLEESDGVRVLVMELVEGETLSEHMRGPTGKCLKPLAVEEVLPIARQIAEALEYAHEHVVVHRDLKPANVKITPEGRVKVLDFGLAKVLNDQDSIAADPENPATLSGVATHAGMLMGTAHYMAPEQARAMPVDRRADIWAFGCVLFEMLAGKKAFEGETISDVVAEVIKSEPEWTALPDATPPSIRRLVRRCLQKDVRQRLQAIGDARIAIEETLSGTWTETGATVDADRIIAAGRSPVRRAMPWVFGATTVLFASVGAYLLLQPKPQQSAIRFAVPLPDHTEFVNGNEVSISPDGRNLVFVAPAGPNIPQVLWLRPLDSLTAHQIPGTEGAFSPFWSPDSQELGFFANGTLERVAISGGTPQVLFQGGSLGASWNRAGIILFSDQGKLYRVPETGGASTLVLAPDPAQEIGYSLPQFLPDGRHFLFRKIDRIAPQASIEAGSLDSKQVVDLGHVGSNALFAPPGYVLYLDQSTLMARPFNAKALRFTGPAVRVEENVGFLRGGAFGFFSVSAAGVLAYQLSLGEAGSEMSSFSRAGAKLGTFGQRDVYTNPAVSPDGSRVAVGVGEHGKRNIWIYDLKRGTASRLTSNPADDTVPVWSADGSRILFSSNRAGGYDIYQKAADGLGNEQPVFQAKGQNKYIDDLSSDGRYAIYDTGSGPNTTQLWGLPLFGDRNPFAFVQGTFGAHAARFSPNGQYVAYSSNETGRAEIYVQTFPQQTGKWQISSSGGEQPMWRRDGKELFYIAPDDKLMSVPVNTSASFQLGVATPLFQSQLAPIPFWRNNYFPFPDGHRFLMLTPASEAKAPPITVVVNWPALVQRGGSN